MSHCRLISGSYRQSISIWCALYVLFFFLNADCLLACLLQMARTTLRFLVRDKYRKSSFFLLKEAMLLTLPCCIRVTPRKTRGHNLGHAVWNHPERLQIIDSELQISLQQDHKLTTPSREKCKWTSNLRTRE